MNRPDPADCLRENYRNVGFWNPTKVLPHEVGQTVHRLDLNECAYPPSPQVLEAIQKAAVNLNWYPDGTCPGLSTRLAEMLDVPRDVICYGAGSTQLLTAITQIAIGSKDNLIAPDLLWQRFRGVFRAADADVTSVPNKPDGAIDVDGMISGIGNRTRLSIALTPNNPTGLMLNADQIRKLCRETPDNVLLFIDEAYHEFAVHAGGADALEIVKERNGPWIVTRTFSKAYALAGLRLGYAICSSQEIANALRLGTSTFNVSGIAEVAALAALDDADYTAFILERNKQEMERIKSACRDMGLGYMDSVTNFIVIDVGVPAGQVVEAMRERSIRIATPGDESRPTSIRVSTGTPDDTDAFLTALEEILDQADRESP